MPARRPSSTIVLQADRTGRGPALLLLPGFADHRAAGGVAFARALAARSLPALRARRDSLGACIWSSHDPEDWAENPHAPRAIA